MSKITFNCTVCGNAKTVDDKGNYRLKYCSLSCQQKDKYNAIIEEFERGERVKPIGSTTRLKEYISSKNDYACVICGVKDWNRKPLVLTLDHIDGNSNNHKPDNVRCICPNCDSQLDTYKGRNKGNGRHTRRHRYAEGKSY